MASILQDIGKDHDDITVSVANALSEYVSGKTDKVQFVASLLDALLEAIEV